MRDGSQLYGQIRIGRVLSVDANRHTAQVQFFELDGFVSWDFPVLVTRPGDYSLPAQNTPVLCLIVDGRLGVGYVLGAIYTDSDSPPLNDDGQRSIVGDARNWKTREIGAFETVSRASCVDNSAYSLWRPGKPISAHHRSCIRGAPGYLLFAIVSADDRDR